MKNFTTKVALFAFLSSCAISILPSNITKLETRWIDLALSASEKQLQCQHALELAEKRINTYEYAVQKCQDFADTAKKFYEAKLALDKAKSNQSILSFFKSK